MAINMLTCYIDCSDSPGSIKFDHWSVVREGKRARAQNEAAADCGRLIPLRSSEAMRL